LGARLSVRGGGALPARPAPIGFLPDGPGNVP
jgi:hypothetical protein